MEAEEREDSEDLLGRTEPMVFLLSDLEDFQEPWDHEVTPCLDATERTEKMLRL